MDVSGQLAGVRGSGDSGHPETIQIRWNDLQALAKSLGYQNRNDELVEVAFRGGAMNGGIGCSLLRRPSAQYNERRA
jgi:hypothetical protein